MGWLISILVSIAKRIVPKLVIWYFTEERGLAHRESDRAKCWALKEAAEQSKTKADDALATYLQARFNFHQSPEAKAAKVGEILDINRAKYVDSPKGGQ